MRPSRSHPSLDIEAFYDLYEPAELEELRAELLAGEIHEAAAIGPAHGACVANLNRLFVSRLGERWIVRVQDAIELPPNSVPQPDLVVAAWRADSYASGLPRPADVRLVVEVSDTTYRRDRFKLSLYAAAGIDEVWIVHLDAEEIEVHTEPSGVRYRRLERRRRGERLAPGLQPDVTLEVSQILPGPAAAGSPERR